MKELLGVLVLVVILLIFSATNPSKEEHYKIYNEYFNEFSSNLTNYMVNSDTSFALSGNEELNTKIKELFSEPIKKSKSDFLNNSIISYNNYFLFSTLEHTSKEDKKTQLTLGILNNINVVSDSTFIIDILLKNF
jgi:hypothetical protein